MNPLQLDEVLNAHHVGNPWDSKTLIADSEYSLPTRRWFLGDFASSFRSLSRQLGFTGWLENRRDCDKYARLAAAWAGILHARSSDRPTGLAIGVIWYRRDSDGQGHAINAAIVEEQGKLEVVFLEPQTQLEVHLTQSERQSCYVRSF